ncbi:TetR/AcrR family transcriptional regulator [Laceyella putida]|uniref:TetR/AcrR family transcriptional regulator n=1 Tax=Laceyella putida TaxID=110101 RepID=A0ABW2RP30_9BACL
MKENLDPRVKRTRRLLREALIALLQEKSLDDITVRDLTERAGINRATFYEHYRDKFDLLDQTIDELLFSLVTHVAPRSVEEFTESGEAIPVFVRMFEFIHEHALYFQVMMGDHGIPSFQRRMLKMIRQFMDKKLDQLHPQPEKMKIPKEIFTYYISYANLGLITYWLENGMQYSAQYMAKQLSELTLRGPYLTSGLDETDENQF